MLRLSAIAGTIVIIMGLSACGHDGIVFPGFDDLNPNPPAGNNPGSSYYQLQAYIELSNTIGHAPMPVNMRAIVKGGKAPFYYRWDVDGDMKWDYGGIGIYEVGINYASPGIYKITLEVEDRNEQSFRATAQVEVKPSGPAAQPSAWPIIGDAPLDVVLDGSGSYDLDGYIVLYEWDYTSDGVYDYSGTDPETSFTYQSQGTYNATLRVTDDDGFTDVASVQIVVL